MTDQPVQFRFYPGAYSNRDVFEASDVSCGVCGNHSGWRYKGSIYGKQIQNVCPACIANGKLAAVAGDAHFTLHDIELEGVDPDLSREVLQRTPGIACFNPYSWPVLDGFPLAFIGYGDDPAIIACTEAQRAIKQSFSAYNWDFEVGTSTPYALVFRELAGPRYQAVIDLD